MEVTKRHEPKKKKIEVWIQVWYKLRTCTIILLIDELSSTSCRQANRLDLNQPSHTNCTTPIFPIATRRTIPKITLSWILKKTSHQNKKNHLIRTTTLIDFNPSALVVWCIRFLVVDYVKKKSLKKRRHNSLDNKNDILSKQNLWSVVDLITEAFHKLK